jgi:hypothetical protein
VGADGTFSAWGTDNVTINLTGPTPHPPDAVYASPLGLDTQFYVAYEGFLYDEPSQAFKDYKFEVKAGATSLRIVYQSSPVFLYTFEMNDDDNSGQPQDFLDIYVAERTIYGDVSSNISTSAGVGGAALIPQNVTAVSISGGVSFTWEPNSFVGFSNYEYRIKVGTGSWSGWVETSGTQINRYLTGSEIGLYGSTATIYIEVRSVSVLYSGASQVKSNSGSANASALAGVLKAKSVSLKARLV